MSNDDRPLEDVDRRTQILDGAVTALSVRGIANLRFKDVARAAGVSVGMVQYYFDSHDELVRSACQWGAWNRVRVWSESMPDSGTQWPRLCAMIDFVFDDKGYFRDASLWLEFCVAAKRDSALKRIMAEIYDAWREPIRQLIDRGVESGEFAPRLNIDDIVDLFAMAMDGSETATAVDAAGLNTVRFATLLKNQISVLLDPKDVG